MDSTTRGRQRGFTDHMTASTSASFVSMVTWPLLIINNPFQKYFLLTFYILQLNTKTE